MEINLNQTMKTLDEVDVEMDSEKLTLRRVCVSALMSLTDDDRNLSGEKRFELGYLARRIHGSEVIDLESKDIVLLKKRIGRMYLPLVVLQSYEMLEKHNEDKGVNEQQGKMGSKENS